MREIKESILNKGLRAEAPYQRLHCEIASLLNSIQDGIYITDGNCNTLKVNSAWEKMSQTKENDVIGRHMEQLVSEGICSQSVSLLVAEQKKPVSIIHRIKSGKEVLITGTPIYGESGNITTIVTTVRDMDELNRIKGELQDSKRKNAQYQRQLKLLAKNEYKEVIGNSTHFKEILNLARQVAPYKSTVLITGESGVGKEVIAKLIHKSSELDGAFIPVNCGAIPENLLESELFGFTKGAFTGANATKMGLIEAAQGGTLFLDEVADLPKHLQVKLLRFIQSKTIKPIGSSKEKAIDVRIIAATNKEIDKMVEKGTFREDLFYRLNVIPIQIPPLRDRKEDIISLADFFVKKAASKKGENIQLSQQAKDFLLDYNWPGNVRELENVIERASVLATSQIINKGDLKIESYSKLKKDGGGLTGQLNNLEKEILYSAQQQFKTTRKIARALDISQTSVVRKLKKHKLV
ncbi:sigma 54-interacting transcriptional regulator [Proteinivorax hydrogeniformans]|uniref:HTH-type transcriptional regulatory protein TyrR n=1 Tax=Proteinivorax hydrogeniformans TaxID=1826727 RepID=A0AAU8HT13_9FIRM